MNFKKVLNTIGDFFKKMGKRNLIIAGAVIMIGLAVYVNWIFFAGDNKDDSFNYDQSAGMNTNYGTTLGTGSNTGNQNSTSADANSYFSSVQVSRQKARDEALEVLNSVVDNDNATDQVKAEAVAEIRQIASEMENEAKIESLIKTKGYAQCVAVISGENVSIVLQHEGELSAAALAQINAIVYEQTGISPAGISIITRE
ncbi:MAG: SpoIIIAH-like family protein [Clostridia bacterium]|jgi:stage III sporulation protein AH|nr:SpoIIIAH-like family protein [Clostridia bacterium]MBQ2255702.1 SpoIIIAH-like family protein [Clostridia bacterium]